MAINGTGMYMMNNEDCRENRENTRERLILVGAALGTQEACDASLSELEELCNTAGADCVGRLIQSRERFSPATYIGKGKLEELKAMILGLAADGIVCDDELSPAQLKNLNDMLSCKVLDRTLLILDIFAERASTSEGKLQVELAQLRYRASRLTGLGTSLSRQGGGIGTRGPGEKQLEVDRRVIHQRIGVLKEELLKVAKNRAVQRSKRKNGELPLAAIVGYTNAGKSTLLNELTGADIYAQNQLFATLDPTTRKLLLPNKQEILLTDTVGFIHKLPHHLIEAFRSTLEEAKYADIIIHVVDSASPDAELHMQVVYDTLKELHIMDKPVITVFNKTDLKEADRMLKDCKAECQIYLSAKTGQGFDALFHAMQEMLLMDSIYIEKTLPFAKASLLARVRREGQLIKEEYRENGIYVEAYIPRKLLAFM